MAPRRISSPLLTPGIDSRLPQHHHAEHEADGRARHDDFGHGMRPPSAFTQTPIRLKLSVLDSIHRPALPSWSVTCARSVSVPRLHPRTIEAVKERADIVDVVGEHVVLKKKGREFVGICPFHDDKSPSMTVSPAKQFYYCFSWVPGATPSSS